MREKALRLRAERGQIIADARLVLKNEGLTPEARVSEFDALMVKADAVKEEIDAIDRLLAAESELETRIELVATTAARSVDEQTANDAEEMGAFRSFLGGGITALTEEQRISNSQRMQEFLSDADPRFRATMSTGVGSEGAYVIPEGFYRILEIAALDYSSGMIDPNVVTVMRTATGAPLPMPTSDDTSNKGERLADNAEVTRQDVAFGTAMLNAFIYSSKIARIPLSLLQDSAFDLNTLLASMLGERIGRIWAEELTTGAGTAGIPHGIVVASTEGHVAAASGAITELELIDLEHSVDPVYRRRGKYMFHDDILAALRKLVDGDGRPIWQAGMTSGAPDIIHGHPYQINMEMAGFGVNAKTVLFGDFKKYHTRIARDIALLRLVERYAEFLQVGFLAHARADGELVDAGTNPIKHLAQAAV